MNKKSTLYQNISPSKYHWIGAGSGLRGVGYNFVVSKKYGRVEVYIDHGDQEVNKYIFDEIQKQKEEIETCFQAPVTWERLNDRRASRIKIETDGNIFEKEQWDSMIEFMTDNMVNLENAFKPHLQKINKQLKKQT